MQQLRAAYYKAIFIKSVQQAKELEEEKNKNNRRVVRSSVIFFFFFLLSSNESGSKISRKTVYRSTGGRNKADPRESLNGQ